VMSPLERLISEYLEKTKGIINYGKHTMYVSTFHSTSIEGSTLTESQVMDLLSYGKTAPKKPFHDHLMVTDHYNAMVFALTLANEKKLLTLDYIQQIAALVMRNTGGIVNTVLGSYDISKGDFRKGGVFAGKRHFPDAKKVPELLSKMMADINSQLSQVQTAEDKLKLSFKIHFEFVSIHPFGDGNGRVSRLLMNYIQTYFNLPISIVSKNARIKYIDALESTRNKDDIQIFYKFMFSEYSKFLKKELKALG
jgi:Fic family protein